MIMSNGLYPTEVISFVHTDGHTASVASNGMRHVTQETETREHPTLEAAISHLEAKGYHIVTDHFRAL